MRRLTVPIILTLVLVSASAALAAWPENGLLLSLLSPTCLVQGVARDGAGGAIVVWIEERNGVDNDIYAQRLDASGSPQWGPNGVAVCVQGGDQVSAAIVPDDAGGAFVAWHDTRGGTSDIYAQRIRSDGSMTWAANGIVVCNAAGNQSTPALASEGSVVLVAWEDGRNQVISSLDIYAQRMDGSGAALWAANGVAVCTASGAQLSVAIESDGAAGAFLAWQDLRSGGNYDLYAHHVNFLGSPDWTAQGVAVDTGVETVSDLRIVLDDAGGMILVWESDDFNSPYVRARRLGPSGATVWNKSLSPWSILSGALAAISDGSGGVIAVWTDTQVIGDYEVYAQRVTHGGARVWGTEGLNVSNTAGIQAKPAVVPDGAGGALIAFVDDRDDPGNYTAMYAVHVDAGGVPRWTPGGVAVETGPAYVTDIKAAAATDGAMFVGWTRFSGDYVPMAQRIEPRHGFWGRPEARILSVNDGPADQGGQVVLNWSASDRDNVNQLGITHYSLWRATEAVSATSGMDATAAGMSRGTIDAERLRAAGFGADVRVVALEDVTADFSGTAVREGTINGVSYLWEFVTTQDALHTAGYSDLVPTRQDSTGGDPAQHYFQVVAHTADSQVYFPSAPDSGYSVDNLAPAAPLLLAAMRLAGDDVDLDWSPSGMVEADFKEYWIYRGAASGFPTDGAHFLMSTLDTMATDTNASVSNAWYYKVVAVDVHLNESDASNEASVSPVTTGIDTRTPQLTTLTVRSYPNPFSGTVALRIGLPSGAPVRASVFDVNGRRVAEQDLGRMDAGWQTVRFDGRDASGRLLPSGVYFYRVRAAGESVTHKLVIQR